MLTGFAALAAGCSGESVDLASGTPSLAGTWTATLTSAVFVANPKPLRLVLDANGVGTLLVGDERIPSPTDPAVGSPPEAEVDAGDRTGLTLHLYDGVEYPLVSPQAGTGRVSFAIDPVNAFEPLCTIQVPLLDGDGDYKCLPDWGGGVDRTGGGKQGRRRGLQVSA
jgi:hypothetical protein